jgi:hypothetical protein
MPAASVFGPNSSLMLGARMSRDWVARKRTHSNGSNTAPYFQVVTLTVDDGWKSLLRL